MTAAAVFTCPVCGATSHNPNDLREGYCGRCHAYTAVTLPGLCPHGVPPEFCGLCHETEGEVDAWLRQANADLVEQVGAHIDTEAGLAAVKQAAELHPCGDYPAPCNCDDPVTHTSGH